MGSQATLLEIAIRKITKGCSRGSGVSQELSLTKSAGVVAAAVQPSVAVTCKVLDNKEVNMMLDSGSSIEESVAANLRTKTNTTPSSLKLVRICSR